MNTKIPAPLSLLQQIPETPKTIPGTHNQPKIKKDVTSKVIEIIPNIVPYILLLMSF